MKTFAINYDDGEYTGSLIVKCRDLRQLDTRVFVADGVTITLHDDSTVVEQMIRGQWRPVPSEKLDTKKRRSHT